MLFFPCLDSSIPTRSGFRDLLEECFSGALALPWPPRKNAVQGWRVGGEAGVLCFFGGVGDDKIRVPLLIYGNAMPKEARKKDIFSARLSQIAIVGTGGVFYVLNFL